MTAAIRGYNGEFKLNINWLKKIVKKEFNMDLNEFYNSYTYDDAEMILNIAKDEGKI